MNDILDFSKIEADKLVIQSVPFNLQRTIDSSVDIAGLRASERIHLAYHICPSTLNMIGDLNRLQQVLLNLLNNAIKFTGEVLLQVSANETQRHTDASSYAHGAAADPALARQGRRRGGRRGGRRHAGGARPMDTEPTASGTVGAAAAPRPGDGLDGTRTAARSS